MQMVAYVAGYRTKTDRPKCADPDLTSVMITINDSRPEDQYGDAWRTKHLKPLVRKLVGSNYGEEGNKFLKDFIIRRVKKAKDTNAYYLKSAEHYSYLDYARLAMTKSAGVPGADYSKGDARFLKIVSKALDELHLQFGGITPAQHKADVNEAEALEQAIMNSTNVRCSAPENAVQLEHVLEVEKVKAHE